MTYWKFVCFVLFASLQLGNEGDCVDLTDRPHVERIEITEGETLSITCKARPKFLRSYRWVYVREGTRTPRVLTSGRRLVVGESRLSIDAQQVDGVVNLILNFKDIRPYDAGLFMCWRQLQKPIPQIYVRVLALDNKGNESMSIKISAPSYVKYGASASITCLITPSWPGKVLWFKNDELISETQRIYIQSIQENTAEDSATLEIVSARATANYTCKVTSSPPTKATALLTVKVIEIESLTTYPKQDVIEYEQRLIITCLVSENDYQVLWLKDGKQIDFEDGDDGITQLNETLPSGKVQSELHIENFSRSNNGYYVCYIPGYSSAILINIEGRSPKILELVGRDFMIGAVLHMTCNVQYNKLDREISWLFEGEPLPENWYPEVVPRYDKYNITHHDLSLPMPTRAHVGNYTCEAAFGAASTEVRNIVVPYVVSNIPEEVITAKNQPVTLTCSIHAYPVPSVAWEKLIDLEWKLLEEAAVEGYTDGIILSGEPLTEEKESEIVVVGNKAMLVIELFSIQHEGQYRCKASNEYKEVIFNTELKIKPPVSEIVHVSGASVVEGEDLIVTCTVRYPDEQRAHPMLFVKGFEVLGLGNNPTHDVSLVSSDEDAEEETFALVIHSAAIEDSGTYECSAGSDVQALVDVVVTAAPPSIIEIAASPAVEDSELFVSCTIENIFTDEGVSFSFNGRNLSADKGDKYRIYLAESKGESVVDLRPRAKLATYVLKVSHATTEDSGLYKCALDSESSHSILVEVEELSTIEQVELKSSAVWLGGDLILSCLVTNWDKEVSFFHNTSAIAEEEDSRYYRSRKQEGNITIHILTIYAATFRDSGFYQCFTTPFNSAETNITITDLESIKLSMEHIPNNTVVVLGSSILLNCGLRGLGTYEHTVEISHDGRPFLYIDTSDKGAQVNSRVAPVEDPDQENSDGTFSYKLRLDNIEISDNGLWDCRVTIPEAGFVIEDSTTLKVFVHLEFVEIPESEYAPYEGDDILLNCSANGLPVPDITWVKAGDEIVNTSSVDGFSQLLLSSITDNDAGIYTCVASSLEQTISTSTSLKITKKDQLMNKINSTTINSQVTIIESPASELFIEKGSSVSLRCEAEASPSPLVQWLKNDTETVLASSNNYAIYSIDHFVSYDEGTYICVASSEGEKTLAFTTLLLDRQIEPDQAASIGTTEVIKDFETSSVSTSSPTPLPESVSISISNVEFVPSRPSTLLSSPLTTLDPISYSTISPNYIDPESEEPDRMLSTSSSSHVSTSILISTVAPFRGLHSDSGSTLDDLSTTATTATFPSVIPTLLEGKLIDLSGPKMVEIQSEFTLLCVISPVLSRFKVMITFNKMMLILNENLAAADSRMSFVIGESPLGDKMVGLTIQNTTKEDSGNYKCIANTDPLVADNHHLDVVPLGSISISAVTQHSIPEMFEDVTEGSTTVSVPITASLPLNDTTDNDVRKYKVQIPESDKIMTEATVGQNVSLVCNSNILVESAEDSYTWYKENPSHLLVKDATMITSDKRITVKNDKLYSTLTIEGVNENDAGTYGCSLHGKNEFSHEQKLIVILIDESTRSEQEFEMIIKDFDKSDHFITDDNIDTTTVMEHLPATSTEAIERSFITLQVTKPSKIDLVSDFSTTPPSDQLSDFSTTSSSDQPYTNEWLSTEQINYSTIASETSEASLDHSDELTTIEYVTEKSDDISVVKVHIAEKSESSEESGETNTEGNVEYSLTMDTDQSHELKDNFVVKTDNASIESKEDALDADDDDHSKITTLDYPIVKDEVVNKVEPKSTKSVVEDHEHLSLSEDTDDHTTKIIDDPSTEKPVETQSTKSVVEDHEHIPRSKDKYDHTTKIIDDHSIEKEVETKSTKLVVVDHEHPSRSEDKNNHTTKIIDDHLEEKDKDTTQKIDKHEKSGVNDSLLFSIEVPSVDLDTNMIDHSIDGLRDKSNATKVKFDAIEIDSTVFDDIVDFDTKLDFIPVFKKKDIKYTTEGSRLDVHDPLPTKIVTIIADPFNPNVNVPADAEVILPCSTNSIPEDISWKESDNLLFLGSLDLGGVDGLTLTPEGNLKLLSDVVDTKKEKTYTCLVYDYIIYDDVEITSYKIDLINQDATASPKLDRSEHHTTESPPMSIFEFPGLEWQEVAVISNSKITGESLVHVLQGGGIKAS